VIRDQNNQHYIPLHYLYITDGGIGVDLTGILGGRMAGLIKVLL